MRTQRIGIFLLVTAVTASCSYLGLEPGEDSAATVAPPELSGA